MLNLLSRPRRLRRTTALRALVQESSLSADDLILPMFVTEEEERSEIESMPGVYRETISSMTEKCKELMDLGLRGVALFPKVPNEKKDADGKESINPESLVIRSVRTLKSACPDLVVAGDLALDPYTVHGHDGILDSKGAVNNDATVAVLAKMAILAASAGIDVVAPSDMMDGRVGEIRKALEDSGFSDTIIMSYSAKFASSYYGPFRDAIGSSRDKSEKPIDKGTYQMNPANFREAVREMQLDYEEGADILMVKPAEPYLDVIKAAKERFTLPIAAYQVSGEYSRVWAASERGWLDFDSCMMESLHSIKRAGADLILTYFAESFLRKQVAAPKGPIVVQEGGASGGASSP